MSHLIQNRIIQLGLLFLACVPVNLQALELPNVFASHMVLQRNRPVQVWGTAIPNSSITVNFAGQDENTQATPNGKWKLSLKALSANTLPQKMTVTGDGKTITYNDILIGDVWICSGQSNMFMNVKRAKNATIEIANAKDKLLRFCRVKQQLSPVPQANLKLSWVVCNPKSVATFSAVGYFFGRALREKIDVPIGLIGSSWGGTPAEAWASESTQKNNPVLVKTFDRWEKKVVTFDARIKNWQKQKFNVQAKRKLWIKNHADKNSKLAMPFKTPRKPPHPKNDPSKPAVLYNAMIHPLASFGIQGAIWYQGESNTWNAKKYRTLLPALIQDWRDLWGQGDFPFGIVQLANYQPTSANPHRSKWAQLRDAQSNTHKTVANTGLAVTIDIGDARDIHPKNKQDVGKRLALWAMHDVYNLANTPYTGPVYAHAKINGSKIALTFDHVNGQLATNDGNEPVEFSICGKAQKWCHAQAIITRKNTLEVWADQITNPVSVRYAWADNPTNPNLTDTSMLPVSPFRTDTYSR